MSIDVGEGSVDGREVDGVVDEKGEAATRTVTRSVTADQGVVWKSWILGTTFQLRFLEARNEHIVLSQEMAKARLGSSETIAIPLQDATRRAWVRMDGGAEKEEEDEETTQWRTIWSCCC